MYMSEKAVTRFLKYVKIVQCSSYVDSPCWMWQRSTKKGYAQFWCKPYGVGASKNHRGHRAAYMHFVGPIPEDMQLDHLCQNEGCVNPQHMDVVSNDENCFRKWDVIKNAMHVEVIDVKSACMV